MRKVNLFLLVVALFALLAVANGQTVPAGDDLWVTDSAGTYDSLALPANYFGPGSLAFSGRVAFKGDPASGVGYDTKITRASSVNLAGGSGTTALKVSELRLKSVSPIVVTYADGTTQKWDVYSTISSLSPSTGSMTISGNSSGGSFSSNLNIIPKFNFVQVTGLKDSLLVGRNTRELDFGQPMVQEYLRVQSKLAGERIEKGLGSEADVIVADACNIEPVPVDPKTPVDRVPVETAAAPAPTCGIKLSATSTWSFTPRFCPFPTAELALLARHGVKPFGCR